MEWLDTRLFKKLFVYFPNFELPVIVACLLSVSVVMVTGQCQRYS